MEGFNEIIEENKTKIIVIAVVLILAIVMSIVNMFIPKASNSKSATDPKAAIEELGTMYYEKLYYDRRVKKFIKDSDYMEKLSEKGIRFNLRDLLSGIEGAKVEIFYGGENYCNFVSTYVTIYPISPYKKDNYRMETTMDCLKKQNSDKEND